MDKKKKEEMRRSSRRLQLTSPKKYVDSEASGSEDYGVGGEVDSDFDGGNGKNNGGGGDRSRGHGGGGDDANGKRRRLMEGGGGGGATPISSTSKHFKWSLQCELFIRQLEKLYFDCEAGGQLSSTDTTLVSSDGDCVEAHKLILVLCCPYFRRLFSKLNRTLNKDNTVVVMGNVKTGILRSIVRFIYTGEADVPSTEEKEFLKVGEFLGISGIRQGQGTCKSSVRDGEAKDSSIKVHVVIDKKLKEGSANTSNFSKTVHVSCKEEPNDQGPSGTYDDSFETFDDAVGGGGDEDDRYSNFSDEIRGGDDGGGGGGDNSRDAMEESRRLGGRDSLSSDPNNPTSYNKGPYKGLWHEMDPLTDEDLQENWRVSCRHAGQDNYQSITYYCFHGGSKKCGARIKRVLDDGEVLFYTNRVDHSGHREGTHGLPHETKIFVNSMLEQGIRKPEKIFKAMRLLSMDLPTKNQLLNFITYQVRKSGKVFPFPERKGPRRIRKRPPNPEGPKKRGRPMKKEKTPRLTVRGVPGGFRKKKDNDQLNSGEKESSSNAGGGGGGSEETKPSTSKSTSNELNNFTSFNQSISSGGGVNAGRSDAHSLQSQHPIIQPHQLLPPLSNPPGAPPHPPASIYHHPYGLPNAPPPSHPNHQFY